MKSIKSSKVVGDSLRLGPLAITFNRTLRIPDDGGQYPLPPGLGPFPLITAAKIRGSLPAGWSRADVVMPMYQREAMWISFNAYDPIAVLVGVGGVNALTGRRFRVGLTRRPQNYLVCPDQPWLDGIKSGEGFIRQFVAMPLGLGYTVGGQVTGREDQSGLQLAAFRTRRGALPKERYFADMSMVMSAPAVSEMGLAAGGKMSQKVYHDDYGIGVWNQDRATVATVRIVDSITYWELTGEKPPPSPISASTYSEHGFPWFQLYDEDRSDVAAQERLARIKTVRELDEQKASRPQQDDSPIPLDPAQVVKLHRRRVSRRPPSS